MCMQKGCNKMKHDSFLMHSVGRDLFLRHMERRDVGDVLRIENESYDQPWAKNKFVLAMRKTGTVGQVVEGEGEILGYVIYAEHRPGTFPMQTLSAGGIEVLNLTIAEKIRRNGLGAKMISHLKRELKRGRSEHLDSILELSMIVGDDALDAQLFLHANGLRAVRVLRGLYSSGEDAYLMAWSKFPDLSVPVFRWANRVESYM